MRNKRTKRMLTNAIINMIFIMALTIVGVSMSAQGSTKESVNEQVTTLSEQMFKKDWDADDNYLLAKIAMAEAEEVQNENQPFRLGTKHDR